MELKRILWLKRIGLTISNKHGGLTRVVKVRSEKGRVKALRAVRP